MRLHVQGLFATYAELRHLRSAFGRYGDSTHKQIGLRRVSTALRCLKSDYATGEACYWEAEFPLQHAEAV
jgi:hypothetical protein